MTHGRFHLNHMTKLTLPIVAAATLLITADRPLAQTAAPAGATFDQALATQVGADEHGMRNYVLVILKTGPDQVPAGPERDEMFRGHMANIARLSKEGKLALAGPFGRRGHLARPLRPRGRRDRGSQRLVATDPVIARGEMIAEYHPFYGSAALMLVPGAHEKIARKSF
jgi:hypothetical protein